MGTWSPRFYFTYICFNYVENQEYRNGEQNVGNAGDRGNVIFRGFSPKILGNVAKHSGEYPKTFRGILSNIPGNVLKYSWEYCQTFPGMPPNIPEDIAIHSEECRQCLVQIMRIIVLNRI